MIWKSEGEAPHPDATCLRLYSCYKFTFIYAVDQGCHVVDILYIWKYSPPFSFRLFCLLNRCLTGRNQMSQIIFLLTLMCLGKFKTHPQLSVEKHAKINIQHWKIISFQPNHILRYTGRNIASLSHHKLSSSNAI